MSICQARWLYRGRTRARCYGEAHHDGKHWNGTVTWTDQTNGAVPDPDTPFLEMPPPVLHKADNCERCQVNIALYGTSYFRTDTGDHIDPPDLLTIVGPLNPVIEADIKRRLA